MTVSDSPSFMQPTDSGILTKKTPKHSPSLVPRFSLLTSPSSWFNYISRHWSIHQKISFGYVLTISIAVLGTSAGLVVGEHYEDKAVETFDIIHRRHELLDQLEKADLQIKLHQQQVIAAPENDTSYLRNQVAQWLESITQTEKLISDLEVNLQDERGFSKADITTAKTSLQDYKNQLKIYAWIAQVFPNKINTASPNFQNTQRVKSLLRGVEPKFKQPSTSLKKLVELDVAQRKDVEATFREAKVLRVLIIVASMTLSIAIAILLAYYTSRAIARPIETVTDVAKQATQDGNFNLQAPVTSENEVGVLATSLNQLIQQVATQINELKQAQAHLIQSEKMSSLGQLVAGIAHEINNPVNFIYGNLRYANDYIQDLLEVVQLYQQHYPHPTPEVQTKLNDIEFEFLNEDLPKILDSMHIGAERIREIILSLRKFCHLDEAQRKQVDIHAEIDNTLLILSHRFNQRIEIVKHYADLPLIECYPAQLNQVFMNTLSNAIDELLEKDNLSKGKIVIQTNVIEDNQIEVRIQDNGSGIAPEIKSKIFDPFFTTKSVGKGTGMGLAICYQVIEKHQGKIEVISEPGQGAEFIFTLPINYSPNNY